MSKAEKILGAIWGIYGVVVFMAVVFPLTILYFILLSIGGRRVSNFCIWVNSKIASPLILALCGIRVKIHNPEFAPKNQNVVFVSNHLTHIDVMANAFACTRPPHFLAKSELKSFPVFGFMVKMLGIMVDRKSKESRDKSFQYLIEALKEGQSVFIYPEGTRNTTNEPLKEFKDGAFRAAIMAQVPIAIQTLVGIKRLNMQQGIHLRPGTIHLYWGKPIDTKGLAMADVDFLKNKVRAEMLKQIETN